jgi:hypothetical protein
VQVDERHATTLIRNADRETRKPPLFETFQHLRQIPAGSEIRPEQKRQFAIHRIEEKIGVLCQIQWTPALPELGVKNEQRTGAQNHDFARSLTRAQFLKQMGQ